MLKFEDSFPLDKITTLQIGGPAKKFVTIHSEEELIEAIQYAKQNTLEFLVIGGGSNLLVNDAGVESLVIKNEITGITETHLRGEPKVSASPHLGGVTLQVKSGTILQDLVDYSIAHGLSGIQKLTGIPGTAGGAVYGNAGAYGQTISDHLTSVVILDTSSVIPSEARNLITLSKKECRFGYRDSGFKTNKHIILEVTFQLTGGDAKLLQKEADEVLQKRLIKYPKGIKCPGSFFKNIVADTLPREVLAKIPQEAVVYGKLPAGYLLAQVGARGASEDGIYIADYHANLFINKGSGTAQVFYQLAQKYAQKVKEKFSITLEPEVQLINLSPLV